MQRVFIKIIASILAASACLGFSACDNKASSSSSSDGRNWRTQTFSNKTLLPFDEETIPFYDNNVTFPITGRDVMICGQLVMFSCQYVAVTSTMNGQKNMDLFAREDLQDGLPPQYMELNNALLYYHDINGRFNKDTVFAPEKFKRTLTESMKVYEYQGKYNSFWAPGNIKYLKLYTVKGEFYNVYYDEVLLFTFGIYDKVKFDDESIDALYSQLITGIKLSVGTAA